MRENKQLVARLAEMDAQLAEANEMRARFASEAALATEAADGELLMLFPASVAFRPHLPSIKSYSLYLHDEDSSSCALFRYFQRHLMVLSGRCSN